MGALKTITRAPAAALRPATRVSSRLRSALSQLTSRLNLLKQLGILTSNASVRLLLLGLLATHGRTLFGALASIIERQVVSRVQVTDNEEAWNWFELLWQSHEVGRDGRVFALAPLKEGEQELIASGADVPLRTTLREDGSTSFLFSPGTEEIISSWSDLLRVPSGYESSLSLPASLHPLEVGLRRLLPFNKHSSTLAWLSFGTREIGARPHDEVFVNTFSLLLRSRATLEALVRKARREYVLDNVDFTHVYMPTSSRDGWERAFGRPKRSKDHVVMDEDKKRALFADAQAFFDPANRTWMAQRGLPYRRGYMLYGPPGNGKTSSVVALAGELDMDIYQLSLHDEAMDESALLRLTQQCSTPCILLIEDIDAVYSGRQRGGAGAAASTETDSGANPGSTGTQLSFSSLLQVLDGAGSSENRLLIMTTNHPERLDPALIRPGRIDVKIEFENASRAQARDLFIRIFSEYEDGAGATSGSSSSTTEAERMREEATERARYGGRAVPLHHSSSSSSSALLVDKNQPPSLTPTELHALADAFAAQLPEDGERPFSMAMLQGFLIRQALRADRFGDLGAAAREAVGRFGRWREGQVRALAAAASSSSPARGGGGAGEAGEEEDEDEEDVCEL